MPSRSSGMKDMDTPRLDDLARGQALQRYVACSRMAPPADGLQAGDGLAQLLLAAAGNARHAQDLAARAMEKLTSSSAVHAVRR